MNLKERLKKQTKSHISKKIRKISIGNLKLVIYPDVFVPIGSSSLVFRNFFKKFNGKCELVLDVGTGSGILALLVSKYAEKVIAIDINENAIKSTKENIKLNHIKNIEVRKSDLFEKVNEKFDLIIFNPPFMGIEAENELEKAFTNKNFEVLTRFFREVKNYLSTNGKIIISFANMGGEEVFNRLIEENNFNKKELYSKNIKDFAGVLTHQYILELTIKD